MSRDLLLTMNRFFKAFFFDLRGFVASGLFWTETLGKVDR